MVNLNVSFVIRREDEGRFVEWMGECLRSLDSKLPGACEISAMREAGGIDYSEMEAHTVACRWTFPTLEEAKKMQRDTLPGIVSEFQTRFSPEGMAFASLFEAIPAK